jgi:hypothetical protein
MPKDPVTDHSGPREHHIGPLIPQTSRLIPQTTRLIPENGRLVPENGRGLSWIGRWTRAGLLAGGCLGCGYGFLAGLIGGLASGAAGIAMFGFAFGGMFGVIAGSFTGLLIGLVQVLLRRILIPIPVIPVAVTEILLLPLQLVAARAGWQLAAVFTYIPSVLALAAAAVLGFRLPPANHPLRGAPDSEEPSAGGSAQPFGATGLRLLFSRPWRYRLAWRRARIASGRR